MRFIRASRGFWPILALLPLVSSVLGQDPPQTGRITRGGVARAQAIVDSVFLDRKGAEGFIEGGDWASYLMARLGVEPLPENTEILIATDSEHIALSGRLQDLPAATRAMLGPLTVLVDSSTVLTADIVMMPDGRGLAHFRLRTVTIGSVPVPEIVLHAMLLEVGERYPALTKSGRDLYVQIPLDGQVALVPGAVRLRVVPVEKSPP